MNTETAISLYQVGRISGAVLIPKRTAHGQVWMAEFVVTTTLPPFITGNLETGDGGPLLFHDVPSALTELRHIGLSETTVQLRAGSSSRCQRFEPLYPWLQGLHALGYDEAKLLDAFAAHPATQLARGHVPALHTARLIIEHALGRSSGQELDARLPHLDVLDIKFLRPTPAGHLCQACCPDSADDFFFLVSLDAPEKHVRYVIADHKPALRSFVLMARHLRQPLADDATTSASGAPCFLLSPADIAYLRSLVTGAPDIIVQRICAHCGIPITDDFVVGPARMISRSKCSVFFHKNRDNCRHAARREVLLSAS